MRERLGRAFRQRAADTLGLFETFELIGIVDVDVIDVAAKAVGVEEDDVVQFRRHVLEVLLHPAGVVGGDPVAAGSVGMERVVDEHA